MKSEIFFRSLGEVSQTWGGKKIDPRLDPLCVESHQKKFHLKRLRNGRVLWSVMEFNPIKVINPSQSWGGKKLDPRLDPLKVKIHQKNFHLKWL